MALSILESIRRLIRQDTVRIGGPVGNMYGAVNSELNLLEATPVQSWLVMEAAGATLPDIDGFFQSYGIFGGRMQLLVAQDGSISSAISQTGRVQLIRAVATIPQRTSFTLRVAVTQPGGECAVYVDGTLARRGEGVTNIPVSLDVGAHEIVVVTNATSTTITAPTSLELSGETDLPARPTWVDVTTNYLDTTIGTAQNTLIWLSDPKVGGYYVLRRQRTPLQSTDEEASPTDATVLSFGALGADGSYPVVIEGAHATQLTVGSELLAEFESLGIISEVLPDRGENTSIRLRLLPGQSLPSSNVIGTYTYLGTFSPITQVARTTNASTLEYVDSAVTFGQAYEYALVAYGLINPAMRSQRSEIMYVVAGDVQPPGSITFLPDYPTTENGFVTARFQTPSDADYLGINIYLHERIQNEVELDTYVDYTVVSVSGRVITINDPELPVNSLVGYKVRWNNGIEYDVQSNTAGTITVARDMLPPPTVGVSLTIFRNVKIKTDYGLPNTRDEVSFTVDQLGRYVFCSFDRARNEQADYEAAYYDVTTLGGGRGAEPVVAFRQLVSGEQQFFADPFKDTAQYAIVELYAFNNGVPAAQKFDGVELYYRRRNDLSDRMLYPVPFSGRAFPWLVSGSAQALLDQPNWVSGSPPPVVSGGILSRYVALARTQEDNWIRVWAENADGLSTDILTFVVDYDDTPEISSLETEIDPTAGQGKVTFTAVIDDDTQGFRWWVTPATGTEPTLASPAHVGDVSLKRFIRRNLIDLPLGTTKTLTLVPYRTWNAVTQKAEGDSGERVDRVLVRTPRSYVAFENKDEFGNRTSEKVTAAYSMSPVPVKLFPAGAASAVWNGSLSNQMVITASGSPGWTAKQYDTGATTAWYYAKLISAKGTLMRRIITNSTTTLTLADDIVEGYNYSDFTQFQIFDGAVIARRREKTVTDTLSTGFLPTTGRETYKRNTDFYIDYYATKNGCLPESTRTTEVDLDSLAEFTSLTMTYNGATRRLTVTANEPDDDCKYWQLYLKVGEYPLVGSQQIAQTALDSNYLRYTSPDVSPASCQFSLTAEPNKTWYAIAVPFNSFNEPGKRIAQTLTTGAGQSDYRLSSVAFSPTAGTSNAVVSFIGSLGATGLVSIQAYDVAVPSNVVTVNGLSLSPSGTVAVGSTTIPLGFTVSSAQTSNQREWRVTATLSGGNTSAGATPVVITGTFYATVGDPIGGGTPALTNLTNTKEENGYCPGSCIDPSFRAFQMVCQWTDSGADRTYYQIDIDLQENNNTPVPVQWGINPTGGPQAYSHQVPCKYVTNSTLGELTNYRFLVKIVRRDNGVVVASAYTPYVTEYLTTCTGNGGGGGGGTGGGGQGAA